VLDRWTRAIIRWRVAVVAGWVVILVLGAVASAKLPDLLTTSLTVPGTSSAQANLILLHNFGENVEGTFTVVVPVAHSSPREVTALEKKLARAASSVPTAKITQEQAVGGLLYANVDTSLNLNRASKATATLRSALTSAGLRGALVTGPPALQHDITPVLTGDLHRGEVLALVLALVLLLIVLGVCWAVVIPFLVAAAIAAGSLAVVYLLAQRFLMVLYIPNVVELIGLGLAIDYSLLIVHRFRGELSDENVSADDAIVTTMSTAGRTIVLSSGAIAIGLATLLIVPVPFVRSLGAAGLVVPVIALAATLTLQPALLSLLGRAGSLPVGGRGLIFRRDVFAGTWARISRGVIHRPVTVLLASLIVLAGFGFSALWLQVTPGSVTAIPQHLPAARALTLVREKAGPGVITPLEIVIDTGAPHLANTSKMAAARLRLADLILRNSEVRVVAIGYKYPYVDASGRYDQIFVIGRHDFGDEASQRFVHELRDEVIPAAHMPSGTKVYVGGAPAQGVDFLSTVYGAFPWIVFVALVLAYWVLVRAFRSLLLPLIAVLLDLLSVGAAYGLLVAVFRFGIGSSILRTYHVSQIEGWVPIFIFAMLFGLSMDYEVFIVSRMRESWDRGSGTARAITEGLAHTGGVVTAAAVIMVGALSGLILGHVAGLQELGVGLALGVLIDATIVRGLLLPSVMALLGRWNWWLPTGIATVVRVAPSPLEDRGARRERTGEGVT
jgi:RND superfamily putative drug exporter